MSKALNVEEIYYFIPHGTVDGGDYDDGTLEGNKLRIAQAIHDLLPEPVSLSRSDISNIISAVAIESVNRADWAGNCADKVIEFIQPYTSAGAVARIKELEENRQTEIDLAVGRALKRNGMADEETIRTLTAQLEEMTRQRDEWKGYYPGDDVDLHMLEIKIIKGAKP